jgi:uncharacterized protein (TIGR00369 family)
MSSDFNAMAKKVNDKFKSMSGLEFVRHMMQHGDGSPMGQLFGQKVIEAKDGMVKIEAMPSSSFYNPMMRIHGGFTATLMDSTLGSAVLTKLPKGSGAGTVCLNVNYVRKIDIETGAIIATANVLHAGRTMLTAEATIRDAAGKLYAHGTGTFLVYPK